MCLHIIQFVQRKFTTKSKNSYVNYEFKKSVLQFLFKKKHRSIELLLGSQNSCFLLSGLTKTMLKRILSRSFHFHLSAPQRSVPTFLNSSNWRDLVSDGCTTSLIIAKDTLPLSKTPTSKYMRITSFSAISQCIPSHLKSNCLMHKTH